MPVFNAGETLERAVASVQTQTFADWELIAVDDGSTDGTAKILEKLARVEPRLRVIRRSHEGLVAALNTGLAVASGEFVARMDADDESHPERLAAQVALLDAATEIGLAGSGVEFGGERAKQAGYALHVDWLNALVTPVQIALNRFVESPLAHPSVTFRRELVSRFGGYRPGDFPEDYELWLRWMAAGVRMAKVPRVLLTWNDSPKRLSRTDARYGPEAFYRVKAEYLARELRRLGVVRDEGVGGRPVFVCGAGRPTRKRAEYLVTHGVKIAGYVDIDPKKTGRDIGGRRVIAPEELPAPGGIFVLGYVANRGAREWIRADLVGRGYEEGRDFLMGA